MKGNDFRESYNRMMLLSNNSTLLKTPILFSKLKKSLQKSKENDISHDSPDRSSPMNIRSLNFSEKKEMLIITYPSNKSESRSFFSSIPKKIIYQLISYLSSDKKNVILEIVSNEDDSKFTHNFQVEKLLVLALPAIVLRDIFESILEEIEVYWIVENSLILSFLFSNERTFSQ